LQRPGRMPPCCACIQSTDRMTTESEELKDYVGKEVVIDTKSTMVYLGRLEAIRNDFITLLDADVYDSSEGPSRKEVYIHQARKFGIRRNRQRVEVRKSEMISISLLSDVVEY